MSETAVRQQQKSAHRLGRMAVSDIEMVSTDLLSCFFFLPFFIIYLTVKWFLTDFE